MPQKSCPAGYTEWLEVDWSQRQHSSNGSLPISRIGIEYYDGSLSGFKPPTANLFLYEKASDANAMPISVTPMLIKGDDQKVYYYSMVPPRRAAKIRFQFTDLVSDSKNECYVAVQEVKVFTSLSSESAPTGDMNSLSISLIVILCILLAIGIPAGAFLYLRQRQLAKRLGFKIIGTDGEMDSR
ncbi:hypothetical protein HDU79_011405 [Rhizoclosmatium sp. JEL0117]|nr:hypothetical protein HDU79_011405 [Rhizoclosmatium sp. JEL0117]